MPASSMARSMARAGSSAFSSIRTRSKASQDEHPGALGEYKAVAVGGEGTRCAFRSIVPVGSEGSQHGVAFHDAVGDWRIHAADQNDRVNARPDVAQRISNCVGRRCAAGSHHVAHAAEPEAQADLTRLRTYRATGNAEEADLLRLPAVPQPVLLFREILRATTSTQHDADLPLFLHGHLLNREPGIFEGFCGSRNGHGHYARDVLALFGVNPGEFVKIFHFTCNVHGQMAGIETRDAAYAAFSGEHCTAECVSADAIGAYDPHTSDNCPRIHVVVQMWDCRCRLRKSL